MAAAGNTPAENQNPAMSIHAHLSDEAQARLHAQKRNSTISSVVISVLAVVIMFLVLGIFLLPSIVEPQEPDVTVIPGEKKRIEIEKPVVRTTLRQNPSPPNHAVTRVLVVNTSSPTAIPTPDSVEVNLSMDFGDANGYGDEMGNGNGPGGTPDFDQIPDDCRKRCTKEDRMLRLREMGGLPEAEDVVEKGLEWLKATQNADGSWTGANQAAMTGFAVLAYLGRCETPLSEKYGESCLRGIAYLVDLGMKNEGKLSTDTANKHWPYEHAIAAYAICEAATFCKSLGISVPNLAETAQQATELIIANQHSTSGGWDYGYDTSGGRGGDLSIAAWHVQALKAASHTGLEFKGMAKAKSAAVDYLVAMQGKNGGFGYTSPPADGGKYAQLTGAGILGLQMSGKESSSAVRKGANYILAGSKFDYNTADSNFYQHYYESQAMMIRGGSEWRKYNDMFKSQLVSNQNPDGSWKAPGFTGLGLNNGHYRNCLAILMLEVYYRFLPGTGAK
jgi:Prenyltransferase and squalene oxidase repeat